MEAIVFIILQIFCNTLIKLRKRGYYAYEMFMNSLLRAFVV